MGSGYEISVNDVLRVVAAVNGLLSDLDGSIQDVSRVMIPAAGYGQVGSTAASSSTTTQDQLIMTLQALANSLQGINQRVKASADGYAEADRQITGVLDQLTTAEKLAFTNRKVLGD